MLPIYSIGLFYIDSPFTGAFLRNKSLTHAGIITQCNEHHVFMHSSITSHGTELVHGKLTPIAFFLLLHCFPYRSS